MSFLDRLKKLVGWGAEHVDVGLDKGVSVGYKGDLPPNWFEKITGIFKKK